MSLWCIVSTSPFIYKKRVKICLVFFSLKFHYQQALKCYPLILLLVEFHVICSMIDIVSDCLDFFLIDLIASKIASFTCSLTLLPTATSAIFANISDGKHLKHLTPVTKYWEAPNKSCAMRCFLPTPEFNRRNLA